MPIDDFEDFSTPKPSGLVALQKIALGLEITLFFFAAVGMLFKVMSFPFADELITFSLIGLSVVYLVLPILLFNSKTVAEHLLAHFFGVYLCLAFISVLAKLMSWPWGYDVASSGLYLSITIGLVLIALIIANFKNIEKRKFYLLMGLRFVLALILIY